MISKTPKPPYYAVIFTSLRTDEDNGYSETADRMVALASEQNGFLGVESARENMGITVSYWRDLEAIRKWREQSEHTLARKKGKAVWYSAFSVRIAKVEQAYDFERNLN